MKIITTKPVFKRIQTWGGSVAPAGYAELPADMDTTLFYAYNGCVDLTVADGVVTAFAPNVVTWEAWKGTQPDYTVALGKRLRQERDEKLAACDWTQMGDSPLDESAKQAWQRYRQALRDLPAQVGFPSDVVWPIAPV